MWPVRDEILFKVTDPPETNPSVLSLANLIRSADAGRFGEFCICFLNELTKAFGSIQARVFCEINIVQEEIPPGGRTPGCPSHRLGRFSLAKDLEGFAFHCVEIFLVGFDVVAALLGFVEKGF